jgi:hypothetical protein
MNNKCTVLISWVLHKFGATNVVDCHLRVSTSSEGSKLAAINPLCSVCSAAKSAPCTGSPHWTFPQATLTNCSVQLFDEYCLFSPQLLQPSTSRLSGSLCNSYANKYFIVSSAFMSSGMRHCVTGCVCPGDLKVHSAFIIRHWAVQEGSLLDL